MLGYLVFLTLLVLIPLTLSKSFLFKNTSQILLINGFKNEPFDITTEDGYILNLVHIFPKNSTLLNQTILMMPALICSSDHFVLGGEYSPAFYLARLGYDIWLINPRGNIYSQRHIDPDISYKQFWNFTYEQKATIDLKSSINFVKEKMKVEKLHLVGYSEGGTTIFAALMMIPEFIEQNVYSVSTWAGASRFDHNRSWMLYFLTKYYLFGVFDSLGFGSTMNPSKLLSILFYVLTEISPPWIVQYFTSFICDFDSRGYTMEGLRGYMTHYPQGESIKTYIHLWMGIIDKGFYHYDFSNSGKLVPFNFSNTANIPILLVHGEDDLFIVPEDALWAFNNFKKAKKNVVINFYKYMGHMSIPAPSNYTKIFLDDTHTFFQNSFKEAKNNRN